jgi:hypothetical protein
MAHQCKPLSRADQILMNAKEVNTLLSRPSVREKENGHAVSRRDVTHQLMFSVIRKHFNIDICILEQFNKVCTML